MDRETLEKKTKERTFCKIETLVGLAKNMASDM